MPMKMIMAAVACATVLLAGGGDFVVEGECPAISRDGTKLAFQRVEGTRMHLGVLDLASGDVTWVVRGETAAPARSPSHSRAGRRTSRNPSAVRFSDSSSGSPICWLKRRLARVAQRNHGK